MLGIPYCPIEILLMVQTIRRENQLRLGSLSICLQGFLVRPKRWLGMGFSTQPKPLISDHTSPGDAMQAFKLCWGETEKDLRDWDQRLILVRNLVALKNPNNTLW